MDIAAWNAKMAITQIEGLRVKKGRRVLTIVRPSELPFHLLEHHFDSQISSKELDKEHKVYVKTEIEEKLISFERQNIIMVFVDQELMITIPIPPVKLETSIELGDAVPQKVVNLLKGDESQFGLTVAGVENVRFFLIESERAKELPQKTFVKRGDAERRKELQDHIKSNPNVGRMMKNQIQVVGASKDLSWVAETFSEERKVIKVSFGTTEENTWADVLIQASQNLKQTPLLKELKLLKEYSDMRGRNVSKTTAGMMDTAEALLNHAVKTLLISHNVLDRVTVGFRREGRLKTFVDLRGTDEAPQEIPGIERMPLLDWFLQEQERLNFQVFVISGESNRANPLNGIGAILKYALMREDR